LEDASNDGDQRPSDALGLRRRPHRQYQARRLPEEIEHPALVHAHGAAWWCASPSAAAAEPQSRSGFLHETLSHRPRRHVSSESTLVKVEIPEGMRVVRVRRWGCSYHERHPVAHCLAPSRHRSLRPDRAKPRGNVDTRTSAQPIA
jgi:hypothetical protein